MSGIAGEIRGASQAGAAMSDDQHIQRLREKIGLDFTTSSKRDDKKNRNELGKDDFLKLMTTQLRHQDPTNPLKNEQMAAQLAQFSSLEQMLNMNQNIEKLAAAQKPTEQMIAASMIGKKVTTANTHIMLEKNGKPDLKFNMPQDCAEAKLIVMNAKGEPVREMDLGEITQGPQSIRWDGKNNKNQDQPVGDYTFAVQAADKDGKSIEVKMDSAGVVTGVAIEGGKSYLVVDGNKVPLSSVGRIEEGGEQAAAGAVKPMAADANGAKKESKQNSSSNASPAVSAQGAKNTLPPGLSPEKIESMLGSAGFKGKVADAKGASQDPAGSSPGNPPPMPLWNPGAN